MDNLNPQSVTSTYYYDLVEYQSWHGKNKSWTIGMFGILKWDNIKIRSTLSIQVGENIINTSQTNEDSHFSLYFDIKTKQLMFLSINV